MALLAAMSSSNMAAQAAITAPTTVAGVEEGAEEVSAASFESLRAASERLTAVGRLQ
jgi:hypothetical protein